MSDKICGDCAMYAGCERQAPRRAGNPPCGFFVPRAPVDLTIMGASVTPDQLAAHPDFVPQPPMPDGEPAHHELVTLVRDLERRVEVLERAMQRRVEVLERAMQRLRDFF